MPIRRRTRLFPSLVVIGLLCISPTVASAAMEACRGDCDLGNDVTVDEVLTLVSIAVGETDLGSCPVADRTCDGAVTVDEIIEAVSRALEGCEGSGRRGELVVEASSAQGILGTTSGGAVQGGTPRMPPQYAVADPGEVSVSVYASGLKVPWAMQFSPDGRMFVTERPGRIRVIRDGQLESQPWATVSPLTEIGEGGLLGLALHPEFPAEPYVYVCHTLTVGGEVQNRVVRYEEVDGHGVNPQPIVSGLPGSSVHNGCRLKFGPDGRLYISTGDGGRRALSQDLSSLGGKILRVNPDGSAPVDNPFPEAPRVWSLGHRNPQGLAFQPRTGALFETEHGPSGEVGVGAYDELNRIEPGANYGWPAVVGAPGLAQYRDPLLTYPYPSGPLPPSGVSFYSGEAIAEWQGDLFFGSLGAEHLQRIGLDACGRIVGIERLYAGEYGRLRDVIGGPDGALYVSTSNRDGRGRPRSDDDRILRLAPR